MRNVLKTLSEKDWQSFLDRGGIFSQGGNVWLFWGDMQVVEDRPACPALCAPEFFLKEPLKWIIFEHSACFDQSLLRKIMSSFVDTPSEYCWEVPEIQSFAEQFSWIQESIRDEKISKAVPCIFEEGYQVTGDKKMLLNSIYNSLQFETGHLYGHWVDGHGILGLTPEVLIEQKEENHFATMALAGTYSLEEYKKDPHRFMEDEKEKNEHLWVVYDIVDALKKYGSVQAQDMEVATTPTLAHLKTTIALDSDSPVAVEELVRALHPTPALGVYPRERSEFALNHLNEGSWRGRFGAPFGFSLNSKESLFVVAIRNFQWMEDRLYIGSGCGVVKQSNMNKEWRELFNKRQSVKQIFDL